MKKAIFIISMAILVSFASACKTKETGAKEVATVGKTISAQPAIDEGNELVGKRWKLIELYGNQIIPDENKPEPHFVFNAEGNRISGNAGCNNFTGSYQVTGVDRIRFSQVATTRKMCINSMDTEEKFLQVLNRADSYIIKNDTLILNRARMAPLACFVAVDN